MQDILCTLKFKETNIFILLFFIFFLCVSLTEYFTLDKINKIYKNQLLYEKADNGVN